MKRLIGVLVVTAAAVGVPRVYPVSVVRAQSTPGAVERGQTRGAVDRMADLRPRSRRDALLAAHADHSRQRRPAAGRLGVSHAPPAQPPAAAAGPGTAAPPQGRGRGRGGSGFAASETTPIVVNGVMYITTPYGRVVALDPTTGKEVWVFQVPAGNPSTRGVEYWPGDAKYAAADHLRHRQRPALLARRQDRPANRDLR